MRKDLFIASVIILIIGFAISGPVGNILLITGIILLLYVIFSKEHIREHSESTSYIDKEYEKGKTSKYKRDLASDRDTTSQYERDTAREKERTNQYEKDRSRRRKSKEKIERELRAWDSKNPGKICPKCGSTSNPYNAQFCADCGTKL